jgi:hypothetical protein
MVANGSAVIDACLGELDVIRLPRVSQPRVDEHHEGQEVTASIHSAGRAPVRAPAAIADNSAPAPGHCAVADSRALPHPSSAHTGRIGRRRSCLCPSEREGLQTGEPLQVGRLQEEKAQAARWLREL